MYDFLCAPLPFVEQISARVDPNFPVANLANDRMGRVMKATSSSPVDFTVDLGGVHSVDFIGLLAMNNSPGTIAHVAAGTANPLPIDGSAQYDSGNVLLNDPVAAKRLHRQKLFVFPAPVNARYVRVRIVPDYTFFTMGRLVIGKMVRAQDGVDTGWSVKVIDLGENKITATSLEDPTIRGKVPEFKWTWSWATEAEARGLLLDTLAYAGTTRPILWCLNPDAGDWHNVTAFGTIQEVPEIANLTSGMADDANAYAVSFKLRSRLVMNL